MSEWIEDVNMSFSELFQNLAQWEAIDKLDFNYSVI